MRSYLAAASFLALLCGPSLASASDGDADTTGAHPAVGFYHVAFRLPGQPLDTSGSCSGSLVAPRIFLTAGHCTFYDTRRLVEAPAYESAEAWATFDPVATDNDFRCFLQDIGYPGAVVFTCDAAGRHHPTFHKAVSVGITHPDYPNIVRKGNGELNIWEPFGPGNTDVAVVLLAAPVAGVTPMPVATGGAVGALTKATRLLGVGYGLDYHKSHPATPDTGPDGNGPTQFRGDYGTRRVADVGTVQTITATRITPTQNNSQGEDSVCYGDSGSPLFAVGADGVVQHTVLAVLTGGALWCQGSHDPYQRVDIATAEGFLACVRNAATNRAACECGVEGNLGLCAGL